MKPPVFDIPGHSIIRKIGEGGMGTVYLAIDNMLQRQVAVKVLKPDALLKDENMQRFQSEAVTLAKLRHPGITMLYNLIRSGTYWCMIMEYVEGETLDTLLKKHGVLPVEEVLRIAVRTLDGLQHAHERGVIHRDMKPSNLMLSTDGEVKIMDFGIARIAGGSRLTRVGQAVGTPQYMSPEQVRGQEGNLASDIYSFGIVLYELLTGVTPFDFESEFEIMQAHTNRKPAPPATLNPVIPDALNSAILKTLSKNPAQRFSGADELKRCLQQIGEEMTAAPAARPSHSSAAFRLRLPKIPALRNILPDMDRRYVVSIGFLAVSLLAVIFVLFLNPAPYHQQRSEPPTGEQTSDKTNRGLEVDRDVSMDDIMRTQRPAELQIPPQDDSRAISLPEGKNRLNPATPPVRDTENRSQPKTTPVNKKESGRKKTPEQKPKEQPQQDVTEKTETVRTEETKQPEEVKQDQEKTETGTTKTLGKQVVIPRGTRVDLVIDTPCDYDSATDRMRVTLSVVAAVECSGVTIIAAGAKAYALLHKNSRRRELELEMLDVESVTGQKLKALHTTYKDAGFTRGKTLKMNLEFNRMKMNQELKIKN
ncbi:MAG: protein kinase [Tannerella sp.]|jgi:serine/threonine-protein kinase|nr:protein kinase [Tannerella sp.]